jgi:hypothetical protein
MLQGGTRTVGAAVLGRNGFLEGVESQIRRIRRHPADVESIKLDELAASRCIGHAIPPIGTRGGEGDVLEE